MNPAEENDDDLNNVTATPGDVAYECGWHDGTDYGYRALDHIYDDDPSHDDKSIVVHFNDGGPNYYVTARHNLDFAAVRIDYDGRTYHLEPDDDLNNVTATPGDVAYECGWHDGTDYGYRLAQQELRCPTCGAQLQAPEA